MCLFCIAVILGGCRCLLLLIHENTRTVFQATPTSSYLQQYRCILLSWSVWYEHVEHVHEYTQTLAASSAAQHLLCPVCCVLSALSTQPSGHPDSSNSKEGYVVCLIYLVSDANLLLFFFRSSLWLLPSPRYNPPILLASCLSCFVFYFIYSFSFLPDLVLYINNIYYFIRLVACGAGGFSES